MNYACGHESTGHNDGPCCAVCELTAALAQEREAREKAERSDEASRAANEILVKHNGFLMRQAERAQAACAQEREAREKAEAACARMRQALGGYGEHRSYCAHVKPVPEHEVKRILASKEPYVVPACDCGLGAALAPDAGDKAAAVIRAAREWRRSRRTGAEDWPASVDLAAAVDALDEVKK